VFHVFLDTHGIAPGEDFQAALWHNLCDCDVLLMLDTATYFEGRWSSAEYGRALAKGIAVLSVGWPDATPSARTATATRVQLLPEDIDLTSGRLADSAIARICAQVEVVRTQSYAVRCVDMTSQLRAAVERLGGSFLGVGPHRAAYVRLPDGRCITIYPVPGVPTSRALHEAAELAKDQPSGVLFDHVGLLPDWLDHLNWLGRHIPAPRWLKVTEVAWDLADWTD